MSSDKHYWHRYTDTYEKAFQALDPVAEILEFGVYRGGSIGWLARTFPAARILGVDIVPQDAGWPTGDRIGYVQLDQGDRAAVRLMLAGLGRLYDLLIEDGSHIPRHQANCLIEALPYMRSGGLFILEDIHTSHPDNAAFAAPGDAGSTNCLHVLLAIQHLKDRGLPMTPAIARGLASPDFFTAGEVVALNDRIATLNMYRRSSLPLHCYACGSDEFDYALLRCRCGVELYSSTDSMSFLIWRA